MDVGLRAYRRRGAGAALIVAGFAIALTGWLPVGLVAAGPAWAHSALVRMVPADGATVSTLPASVRLVFNEAVQDGYQAVAVTAPDGATVTVGRAQVLGSAVRQPIRPGSAAGRHTVVYRVVSADGHVVSGRLSFRYAPAALAKTPTAAPTSPSPPAASPRPASPPAAPRATSSSEGSGLLMPALGAGLLALGGGLALRRRRSRP